MGTPPPAPLTTEQLEVLNRHIGILDDASQMFVLVAQQKISFYEKLVVLKGATLTLTFAVVGALSNHLTNGHSHAVRIPFIILACWLFLIGTLLSIVQNLFMMNAMINAQASSMGLSVNLKHSAFYAWLKGSGSDAKNTNSPIDTSRYSRGMGHAELISRIVGPFAQLATAAGFIVLMLFIQANIYLILSAPDLSTPKPLLHISTSVL